MLNSTSGAGVAGVQVYLDNNNNGVYDAGDTAVTTDSNGVYVFSGLMPASATSATTYTVRLTAPAGYVLASTSAGSYSPQLVQGDGESGDDFTLTAATVGRRPRQRRRHQRQSGRNDLP